MHSINRLAVAHAPILVTVTYPGVWLQKPEGVAANRRAICKRIMRMGREVSIFWRIEYQKRGAPHFHLLVFGLSSPEILRETLPEAWTAVIGTKATHHLARGCDVRASKGWRGVIAYLSKYLAKVADADAPAVEHAGRWWGIENRAYLPVEPLEFRLLVGQGVKVRRWILRAAGRRRRHSGPVGASTVFCSADAVVRAVRYVRASATGRASPPHGADRVALARWQHAEEKQVLSFL